MLCWEVQDVLLHCGAGAVLHDVCWWIVVLGWLAGWVVHRHAWMAEAMLMVYTTCLDRAGMLCLSWAACRS